MSPRKARFSVQTKFYISRDTYVWKIQQAESSVTLHRRSPEWGLVVQQDLDQVESGPVDQAASSTVSDRQRRPSRSRKATWTSRWTIYIVRWIELFESFMCFQHNKSQAYLHFST